MYKFSFIVVIATLLASCSSHKYSISERTENNSFFITSNVPDLSISTLSSPNQRIQSQNLGQINGQFSSKNTFDKLNRSTKIIVISKENYIPDTLNLERAPRGKAIAKDILLGCILFPIAPVPILIDLCKADFYKISKNTKRLDVLLEYTQEYMEKKYFEIQNATNADVFQQYLSLYPKSTKIGFAIDKRDSIELIDAINMSSEEAIENFISKHEESRFLAEATKIRDEMKAAKLDFELSKSRNTVASYEEYLLNYPNSLQRNAAINLLVDLSLKQAIATKKSSELIKFNNDYLLKYKQSLNNDTIINQSKLLTSRLDEFLVRENTLPKVNNYVQYSNLWNQYIDLSLQFENIGQLKLCESQLNNICDFLLGEIAKINTKDQQVSFIAKANLDFRGLQFVKVDSKTGEKKLKSTIAFINLVIDNSKKFNGTLKLYNQKYFENRTYKLYMQDDVYSAMGSFVYKDQSTHNVFEQIKNTICEEITIKAGTITEAKLYDGSVIFVAGKFSETQSEISHYVNGILVVTQYEGNGQGYYKYEFENGVNISLRELENQIKKADFELANKNYDAAIEMYKKIAKNGYPTSIPLNQRILKSITLAEGEKLISDKNLEILDMKADEAGKLYFNLVRLDGNNNPISTSSSNLVENNLNKNQSVRDYVEGKFYKNNTIGKRIKYGYISSYNTYGIIFDTDGNLTYFVNCTERLSSDEQFMELTGCMDTYSGRTLNRIGVYKNKIIWYGTDGDLVFYPDDNQNTNSTKSVKELLSEVYMSNVSNLQIAHFDVNDLQMTTLQEAKVICSNIGKGWRLPTRNELVVMYNHKDELNMEKAVTRFISYLGIENNKLIKLNMIDGQITDVIVVSNSDKIRAVKR